MTKRSSTNDPFDLQRFVVAQKPDYSNACEELRRGRKTSHWMWYIFPQFRGLGRSKLAQEYAITSRAEAVAYALHPTLGRRLIECTELVMRISGRSIDEIFGETDAMKFRSCMTLFARATNEKVFGRAIEKYFGGAYDQATIDLMTASGD